MKLIELEARTTIKKTKKITTVGGISAMNLKIKRTMFTHSLS